MGFTLIFYKNYELWQGDCLELMKNIPDRSVDMILCDLPYGTNACSWDTIIPFEKIWEQYNRIIKDRSAIVLFATQPFTSKLICSNLDMFKYCWTWDKCKVGGFTSAKLKPLKLFEDICVFSKGKTANCNPNNMNYYPQGLIKVDKISRSSNDTSPTGYARPSQHKNDTGHHLRTACKRGCRCDMQRFGPCRSNHKIISVLKKHPRFGGASVSTQLFLQSNLNLELRNIVHICSRIHLSNFLEETHVKNELAL